MSKKLFLFLGMTLGLGLLAGPAQARHMHTPHHPTHHGAGVDPGAGYADIVIDASTGRIIHQTDADELRHPASLTKMMTLYITFQALEAGKFNLDQEIPVSENASAQSPSKLGLHAGQSIRVEDAVLGLVTESANDAAVTLGEAIGGSEEGFGALMTKQAHALGMSQTVFHNPSGLPDPDQVTTAHDMALLGAALIRHYPAFYPYFSHESFTYAGVFHHNHNHLMSRYDGMDGIKTGYIRASGFNLVASAKRDGVRLIGVVFGGHSAVARDNHMAELLDNSFAEAANDARNGKVAPANGEGDGNDKDADNDYVTLPAKVSAIFPHGGDQGGQGTRVAASDTDGDDARHEAPPARVAAAAPLPPAAAGDSDDRPAAKTAIAPAKPLRQQVAMLTPPPRSSVVVPSAAPNPAATPLPSKGKTGSWGIQIGAYSDAAICQQALSTLSSSMPDSLSGGDAQVQKISTGGVTMYRARVMELDRKTAQNVCSYLIRRGKSCLTVEP